MKEPESPVARVLALLWYIAVFLLVSFVVHLSLSTATDLLEPDEYFHLRLAHLTQENHGKVSAFPWAAISTWDTAWADSSYLYHVFLIPFLKEGDPLGSARPAVAVLAGLLSVVYCWLLSQRKVPWVWVWLLLLWSSGNIFVSRMFRARALVLSLTLVLLMVHCLIEKRRIWLFFIAMVYPLCYTALHLPVCLWAVVTLGCLLLDEGIDFGSLAVLVAGVACGTMLHPNFHQLLRMWWYQNAFVLGYSWANHEWIGFASELGAFSTKQLFISVFVPIVIQVVAVVAMALRRRALARDTFLLMLVSLAFGGLMCLSIRFVEYFAPFTVWYGAVLARDLIDPEEIQRSRRTQPVISLLAAVVAGIVLALLFFRNARDVKASLDRATSKDPEIIHRMTQWLDKNTPAGSTVCSASFGEVSSLFYWSRHNRYLAFLDPMFFYQRDPHRFYLWRQMERGNLFDPVRAIRDDLGCNFAYIRSEWPGLLTALPRDPRVQVRVYTKTASILSFLPDPPLVSQWLVGAQDSPVPQPAPEALLSWCRTTGARLPASHQWRIYDAKSYGSTVSLDRAIPPLPAGLSLLDPAAPAAESTGDPNADPPEPLSTREAYAVTEFTATESQPVAFAIGFCGEFSLRLNGAQLFADHGPGGGAIGRFTVHGTAAAGVNRLLVRCRSAGNAWGFSLAASPERTPVTFAAPGGIAKK